VAVAILNIVMFSGTGDLDQQAKAEIYASIYLMAMIIPVLSVSGVFLAAWQVRRARARMQRAGMTSAQAQAAISRPAGHTKVNHWYFTGGLVFVVLTLSIGLSDVSFAQEIVFAGSMGIVLFLMRQLIANLPPYKARALVGTAIIIFVFRAVPLNGAAATWFEIDELGFDEQFLSLLYLIVSVLTLAGIIVLRPMIASHPITRIIVFLTVVGGVLSLPNIGLYYGIQNWTAPLTGGVVDARFIALIDAGVESPLGQVAMIPMLAWIARNAPDNLKATFFAVMASFTNLALSASALATKYMNQIFVVTREVIDPNTGNVTVAADYSTLGWLLITVAALGFALPLLAVALVQVSPLKTTD
jgi:BT1 family protein